VTRYSMPLGLTVSNMMLSVLMDMLLSRYMQCQGTSIPKRILLSLQPFVMTIVLALA
jgi:hypothetical protein